jgi:hypothetical protein
MVEFVEEGNSRERETYVSIEDGGGRPGNPLNHPFLIFFIKNDVILGTFFKLIFFFQNGILVI